MWCEEREHFICMPDFPRQDLRVGQMHCFLSNLTIRSAWLYSLAIQHLFSLPYSSLSPFHSRPDQECPCFKAKNMISFHVLILPKVCSLMPWFSAEHRTQGPASCLHRSSRNQSKTMPKLSVNQTQGDKFIRLMIVELVPIQTLLQHQIRF